MLREEKLWFFEHQYSWNTKFQTGNISLEKCLDE